MLIGRDSMVSASSVLQGKALAVRLARQLLDANEISNAIIETHDKVVIHLCSTKNVPPWTLGLWIFELLGGSTENAQLLLKIFKLFLLLCFVHFLGPLGNAIGLLIRYHLLN